MGSPILVLSSFTVTSLFILAFLIISIRRQWNKIKQKVENKPVSTKKPKDGKSISNNSRKSGNSNNDQNANNNQNLNFDFINSMTYQKIKAELSKKKNNINIIIEGNDQILNSELRKLNNNQNNLN